MSHHKYLLATMAAAALLACVLARPASQDIKEFVVSEIANKTMCPIRVSIDDVEDRIPRRIKFLECETEPNRMCHEHHMTLGCCKHHHHTYRTECVEIYDFVQVTYRGVPEPKTIKVPVGCTCLIEETTVAAEVS